MNGLGSKGGYQMVKNYPKLKFYLKIIKILMKKVIICSVWAEEKTTPRGPSKGAWPKQKITT